MKTPREILLRQHQAAAPKLDAIRAGVISANFRPSAPATISWREAARSLRWHLAAWSAAWVVVMILNIDPLPSGAAMIARDKIPPPQQIWASLRERRRLLLEDNDGPVVQAPVLPGRRSKIERKQVVV
jgi:hypothetical protein